MGTLLLAVVLMVFGGVYYLYTSKQLLKLQVSDLRSQLTIKDKAISDLTDEMLIIKNAKAVDTNVLTTLIDKNTSFNKTMTNVFTTKDTGIRNNNSGMVIVNDKSKAISILNLEAIESAYKEFTNLNGVTK